MIDDGKIDADEVRELLGRPKVHPERAAETNEVGIATGMYYTPMGGDIMFVEASIRRYYGGRLTSTRRCRSARAARCRSFSPASSAT